MRYVAIGKNATYPNLDEAKAVCSEDTYCEGIQVYHQVIKLCRYQFARSLETVVQPSKPGVYVKKRRKHLLL